MQIPGMGGSRDRHERRPTGTQRLDGLVERVHALLGLRREELEGDDGVLAPEQVDDSHGRWRA